MNKHFKRGLVVGKFSPLHRGHELIINRAIEDCDEVVLLCYSKPELPGCDSSRRERWLSALFPSIRHLVVTDELLGRLVKVGEGPRDVPHNDAAELTHRRFCGFLCSHVLGVTVDAVFTSEDYGDGFAAELTNYFQKQDAALPAVKHILVDKDRTKLPISGTLLRQDIHAHSDWLAPEVYASFVQRVCLLGGESTGKSTLAEALAREFSTVHAAEYGRDLWEAKSGALTFADMLHIAEIQIQREDEAALKAKRFIFCDTSPLTTLFYSQHFFGKAETALEELANRSYDFIFLCAPDFPFVQDGTRKPEDFRLLQHEWYLHESNLRKISFHLVTGSNENRIRQIREHLSTPRVSAAPSGAESL
ncbi:MAG: AAA family ATPase [Verrucomicrobiota bacterium]